MALTHNLGFPRIGSKRQLKFAQEAYWKGEIDEPQLQETAYQIRRQNYAWQTALDLQQVGDFSFYDQVLDTSILLGVVPERFKTAAPSSSLETLFFMARGQNRGGEEAAACAMTKWFNTNYHYLVPELHNKQQFKVCSAKLIAEIKEAQQLAKPLKAVVLGPLSWLYLAGGITDDAKFELLEPLIAAYEQILGEISALGVDWVQIDEPILVLDLAAPWQQAFITAYNKLATSRVKLLLTTYFGALADNFTAVVQHLPVAGLHIDAVDGNELAAIAAKWPEQKVLSVGIVNGRNIWANDLRTSLAQLQPVAQKFADNLWVAPSCSLLHVPVDLAQEDKLEASQKSWFAFAVQKIQEVAILAKGLNEGEQAIAAELDAADKVKQNRVQAAHLHQAAVKARVEAIDAAAATRTSAYAQRAVKQQALLNLPLLPTTTIGSFPQTEHIRRLRRDFKAARLSWEEYRTAICEQIKIVIREQEELGLDVLVHGEPERNDMVEYFGEQLENFVITRFGWVQSYGSRCVKPPIIVGDVWLKEPMTVSWLQYAQSLTDKKVKGMLTGPVTILAWSFKREDISYRQSAYQIALALRDEVAALEQAGISIIQVDEPAFRELLPLRKQEQAQYLEWATRAFRLATAVVGDQTQIHTHMCYSSFNEIIAQIAQLDADVITIETSRSKMKLLDAFKQFAYPNEIGPGVFDIHSPRVPTVAEIKTLIELAAEQIPPQRLWINPDCGLKTRQWPQVRAALKAMVQAAEELRRKYS